jgi:hypothetical protein
LRLAEDAPCAGVFGRRTGVVFEQLEQRQGGDVEQSASSDGMARRERMMQPARPFREPPTVPASHERPARMEMGRDEPLDLCPSVVASFFRFACAQLAHNAMSHVLRLSRRRTGQTARAEV